MDDVWEKNAEENIWNEEEVTETLSKLTSDRVASFILFCKYVLGWWNGCWDKRIMSKYGRDKRV